MNELQHIATQEFATIRVPLSEKCQDKFIVCVSEGGAVYKNNVTLLQLGNIVQ